MPVWQIYHSETAFTESDKSQIAAQITDLYAPFMPRFYVNVMYHILPRTSFYVGGEPTDDLVRVTIDHIARSMVDDETKRLFLMRCNDILKPFVTQRGLRWELNADETPAPELWMINGLRPPLPGSEEEQRWKTETALPRTAAPRAATTLDVALHATTTRWLWIASRRSCQAIRHRVDTTAGPQDGGGPQGLFKVGVTA